jgi:hypothetical protein
MEVKGDWVFTHAKYLQDDYDRMNALGIYNDPAYVMEPFRFKLSLLESYNKASEGLTTIKVSEDRITISEVFDDFDKFIVELSINK